MIGRIVREYGQTLEVCSEGQVYTCFPRKNIDSTVVGDFVKFEWDQNTAQGVIIERLPRRNLLSRSDRYHPIKEMAANLDQILILFAVSPKPNEFYLDEYLVAAELIGVPVIMILNKADLLFDENIQSLKAHYEKIGYPILKISAKTKEGLPILKEKLQGKTSFLLGPSGVGKSSLINALTGIEVAKVQQISAANEKGQHTTSVSMLYALKEGGAIIDVPGIRELILPAAYKPKLIEGFKEFQPYLGQCRFRNCAHQGDPGCMILEKVNTQEISEERLKNYYRMRDA